jgi:inner membrane protein
VDNVCHTLVGAAIGEAGLKRHTRFAAAALMISANIPDLDVLVFATDTPSISFRRGWTHGVAAQVLLPIALTGVFWLLARGRGRDVPGSPPFRPGWVLLLSYVGVYSHVFLDYLNNYGVRLLTPFDWHWFYGDAMFIVDLWLWLVLGAGIWFTRRRRSPRASRYALALATIYIAVMLVLARTARSTVGGQWAGSHGTAPQALMVAPRAVSPMTRDVIVDAGDHYERGEFSWPAVLELSPERIPKNDDRPEVAAARNDPGIRAFLVWSRFPFWTIEPVDGGTRVTVTDARFMAAGFFSASTIVPARHPASD